MKLTSTRIIQVEQHFALSPSFGETVGGMVDQCIAAALMDNQTLLSINVEFTPEEWADLADKGETTVTVNPGPTPHGKTQLRSSSSSRT